MRVDYLIYERFWLEAKRKSREINECNLDLTLPFQPFIKPEWREMDVI